MKVVVCFLGLLALASAQLPVRPCESPMEFEARSVGHDPMRKEVEYQRIYYNELEGAVRHIDEIYENKTSTALDVLYLHKVKKMYVLDMKTKECQERPLTSPFRPISPSRNATLFGEMWIGSEGYQEGVLVQSWHWKSEHGGYIHGHFTRVKCIPVSHSYYSDTTGIVFRNYYDVAGIRDRDVFTPPKECKK